MANLRIELGGRTVTARLDGRVVRVGRDPDCDLTVDDASVAAVHVTFESLPGGGHKLTDANSGLPTKVNGLIVKRVSLRPGDIIEVGPARLTYLAEGAPAPAPVASPSRSRPPAPSASAPSPRGAAVAVAVAPAVVTAPVEPGASALIDDEAVTAVEAPSRAPPAAGVVSRSRPKGRAVQFLVGLGVFAAAAIGIAYAVRNSGDGGASDLKSYKDRLDLAEKLEATDIDLSLAKLDELARPDVPLEGIRREAKRESEHLRARLEAAAKEFKALETQAGEYDPDRLATAYQLLVDTYGKAIAMRYKGALARAGSTYRDQAAGKGRELTARAEVFLGSENFGDALKIFDAYELDSPWNEVTHQIVDDGRALVAERAGAAWKASAATAAEISASKGPASAAMWLRERLPSFAGTSLAKAVAERAAGYDRQVSASSPPTTASVPTATKPTPSAPTPVSAPGIAPGTAPSAPSSLSMAAKLEGLLADADTRVSSRKFVEALALLDEAAKIATGSSSAARVGFARADVAAALEGVRTLAATMTAHPDRFERFEISGSFAPSLIGADDRFIEAVIAGGRTRLPWSTFDGARLSRLVERARIAGKASLPLAALLHEANAEESAERALARVLEDGGEKGAVDALLARWRGEAVPAGGYVAHAGRLVSPAERDRLLIDVRITAACAKVGSKDGAQRRASYEELLAIGAPAKETFVKALMARRAAAVAEVSGHHTFTSGRIRQRLVVELEKRRAVALALIEDDKAYPYPYTEAHEGQAEVNRLVDLVREVWERPFDLVSTWEKNLGEAMALVTEVDEVLAKVEEGYAADLDAVKAAINKAIDVPGVVPDDTSKKVLAYNEKVSTSATPQERDNVRAVNEYRMMMGRTAVKIDERLERAARGHSIEMRLKGYFAHESATPGLESPGKRCAREGYGSGTGENIAYGVTSGRAAFDGWFHSSGHHRNMVNKGWTEMGCGRSGPGHWTQNFGAMTGHNTKEPDPLPPPRADVAPEPEGPDGMPAEAGASSGSAKPNDPAMGG